MNINSNHSYNEVKHNLDILAKTLSKIENPSLIKIGEIVESIDLGFIDIFENDIRKLKAENFDQSKINELSKKLQTQAEKIKKYAGKTFTHQTKEKQLTRPIDEKIIGEVIQKYKYSDAKFTGEESLKVTLEKIGADYDLHPIYGDGHCLYRSVATSIVQNIDKFPGLIPSIKNKCGANNPYIKEESFTEVEKIFKDIENKSTDITNQKTSNELVQFFRMIASAYIHKQSDSDDDYKDHLSGEVSSNDHSSIEDYLQKMISMKDARYGGDREILALADLLDIQILTKDVRNEDVLLGNSENPKMEMPLLFTVNHYDLLVKK